MRKNTALNMCSVVAMSMVLAQCDMQDGGFMSPFGADSFDPLADDAQPASDDTAEMMDDEMDAMAEGSQGETADLSADSFDPIAAPMTNNDPLVFWRIARTGSVAATVPQMEVISQNTQAMNLLTVPGAKVYNEGEQEVAQNPFDFLSFLGFSEATAGERLVVEPPAQVANLGFADFFSPAPAQPAAPASQETSSTSTAAAPKPEAPASTAAPKAATTSSASSNSSTASAAVSAATSAASTAAVTATSVAPSAPAPNLFDFLNVEPSLDAEANIASIEAEVKTEAEQQALAEQQAAIAAAAEQKAAEEAAAKKAAEEAAAAAAAQALADQQAAVEAAAAQKAAEEAAAQQAAEEAAAAEAAAAAEEPVVIASADTEGASATEGQSSEVTNTGEGNVGEASNVGLEQSWVFEGMSITFNNGAYYGSTGCNEFSGRYMRWLGQRVVIYKPDVKTNTCDDAAIADKETKLRENFGGTYNVLFDGNNMFLMSDRSNWLLSSK